MNYYRFKLRCIYRFDCLFLNWRRSFFNHRSRGFLYDLNGAFKGDVFLRKILFANSFRQFFRD